MSKHSSTNRMLNLNSQTFKQEPSSIHFVWHHNQAHNNTPHTILRTVMEATGSPSCFHTSTLTSWMQNEPSHHRSHRTPLARRSQSCRATKHAQRSQRCKMCRRWLCGGCPWMTALVDQNEQLWAHQKAEAVLVKDDMLMHILHEATCTQEWTRW